VEVLSERACILLGPSHTFELDNIIQKYKRARTEVAGSFVRN